MAQPVHIQNQDSFVIEDDDITKADSDSVPISVSNTKVPVPNYWQSAMFKKNNQWLIYTVEEGSNDYVKVKSSFVNGMRSIDNQIDVVEIHRKNYKWSVMEDAREEAFRFFAAAVGSKNGGDPNITHGWYGGSRDELRQILSHGFCLFDNRSSSHGHGVYFSPANNPIPSAKMSFADVDGVYHILLCRLILGKQEPIPFGSQIDLPTSTEFDSGVDDISSPTKYIIWEPYMNTTILPVFIVSFKSKKLGRSFIVSSETWDYIMEKHLRKYVSSLTMTLIKRLQDELVDNKISRAEFARNLRLIVGDNVLRAVFRRHGR